jgi:hypothetical protein
MCSSWSEAADAVVGRAASDPAHVDGWVQFDPREIRFEGAVEAPDLTRLKTLLHGRSNFHVNDNWSDLDPVASARAA